MSEEKTKAKGLDLHSEPVQEILGHPPGWLVRCGISVIVAVTVGLFIGSRCIKYPNILTASITVNANNLPAQVKSRATGRIDTIFVSEGDYVGVNQPLSMIENTASYEDVTYLKTMLGSVPSDSVWQPTRELRLGELQDYYAAYIQASDALRIFRQNAYHSKKITSLKQQIRVYENLRDNLEHQVKLTHEQLLITKDQFVADSCIYSEGYSSRKEYGISRSNYIQQKMAYKSMAGNLEDMKLNIIQSQQNVIELEQDYYEQNDKLVTSLGVAYERLLSQIEQWEQNYLLTSPIEGRVALTMFWQENQNVTAGETIMTIVPVEDGNHHGKIQLSQQGAGKVKTGQKVNIKFDDYPYMEFGFVQVNLTSISLVPYGDAANGNIYIMDVEMPDSLVTKYGIPIPYRPEMSGTAEIITEDLTVFDRLLNPIKAVVKR